MSATQPPRDLGRSALENVPLPYGDTDADVLAELAALVPDPAPRDLSAARRRELRARFLDGAEHSRDLGGHAGADGCAGSDGRAGKDGRARPRRLMLALASTAVAGTLAGGLLLGSWSTGGQEHEEPGRYSPAAVALLDRVASTAAGRAPVDVRDDQFVYTRAEGFAAALDGDSGQLSRTDQGEEKWTSVDGGVRSLRRAPDGTEGWLDAPGEGDLGSPTYRYLEGLPADPEALLRIIHADAELNHGAGSDSTTGPDQQSFVTIGDLLRCGAAPPRVSAALYRAAALIPGVTVVPDGVDAVGRRGIAVARVHKGKRLEWIFERTSLELLGSRSVVLEDGPWGKAGSTVESFAVTGSGIADQAGAAPRRERSPRH